MFPYKYPAPRANARIKKPQVILQRIETTQQTNIRLTISMIELHFLADCDTSTNTTTRIYSAIAGITAIVYSERGIT